MGLSAASAGATATHRSRAPARIKSAPRSLKLRSEHVGFIYSLTISTFGVLSMACAQRPAGWPRIAQSLSTNLTKHEFEPCGSTSAPRAKGRITGVASQLNRVADSTCHIGGAMPRLGIRVALSNTSDPKGPKRKEG